MWLQSCSLVSVILKMMMVWNSVGETRSEAGEVCTTQDNITGFLC